MYRACATVLACVVALVSATAVHAAAPGKRPNVIILLTDDNGYGDLSCHGNPVVKTPNLDRVHRQSVRLTDFHVAPMCTPTRGQLMTGVDACRNGATSVSAGRSFVRRGIPLMPEMFAKGGYQTAMFGKWHLGDSYPNLPHQRGFGEAVYFLGWGVTSMADLWQNDNFNPRYQHNGALQQYLGYCTDIWFDLAMDWIKKEQADNKPFLLYLPTNAAHGPLWVPNKYKEPYKGKGPAGFFGMMANIDENVGRLDAFLKENKLFDDTIFIYMNDNGGTAGVNTYNAGMRGRKTQYYEGGHRSACFIRWPKGDLRKPSDLDVNSEVQDILPTLLDLCGVDRPANAHFDGTSLAPVLRGKDETVPDRMLVVQYGQVPAKWDCCVMWNKWRLVHGKELYNIASDPGQKQDVAAEHSDVVNKMRAHYEAWWAEIAPKLDDFTPVVIGNDKENPVTLSAADWANVYCDNMQQLRAGANSNGPWHIQVDQDGRYEIELRRWPKEADAAIAAGVPEFKAVDGKLPAGKALPIVKARLKLGDFDESKPVAPDQKGVTFTLPLKAGKTQLQTWFYDADGKPLCGAYFAYVKRL